MKSRQEDKHAPHKGRDAITTLARANLFAALVALEGERPRRC